MSLTKNKIYQGDVLKVLTTFPDDCVDTIITSPPYWGLRDYGVEEQLGLEPDLDEYICNMLTVSYQLKRVLKPTGVMFWNHGDCYGASESRRDIIAGALGDKRKKKTPVYKRPNVIPQKCLALQNYRLILKMIDEQGWILRNTIIWHKPNHMPSSVKDRFANAYEPVFMLVKKKKYWFDLDAVREEYTKPLDRWGGEKLEAKGKSSWSEETGQPMYRNRDLRPNKAGKNPGDVWKIATQPFPEAHFATFPEKLVEPMIKSSCPSEICKKCGKARVRISKKETTGVQKKRPFRSGLGYEQRQRAGDSSTITLGWTDCGCKAGWEAGIVLDPFIGSGTTAKVARKHGRNWLGIELSKEYIKIAEKRLAQQTLGV